MIPRLSRVRTVAMWIVAGMLIAVALWGQGRYYRTQIVERDRIITRFVEVATESTIEPDARGERPPLTPDEALAANRALARDRADARAELARIDRDSRAARAHSVQSDATLRRANTGNARTFAREVAPRIERLETLPAPKGDAAEARTIDDVSKEAWK